MAGEDESSACILRRIADTLGIPVERFFAEDASGSVADTRECLRLWSELTTDAGRAAALDALRRIRADEGS